MFGKSFRILKELPYIFEKVGDNYPEYFWVYENNGELDYCIIDDNFGQPSPANYYSGEYAKKLRDRCSDILIELIEDEYIEEV